MEKSFVSKVNRLAIMHEITAHYSQKYTTNNQLTQIHFSNKYMFDFLCIVGVQPEWGEETVLMLM